VIDCRQLAGLLLGFLERELSEQDLGLVREHLAGCPSCAAHVASYERVVAWAGQLPRLPVPVQVLHDLRRAVGELRADGFSSN
jgi:anti-sigma factor RsiW